MAFANSLYSQNMERLDAKPTIICYAGDHSAFTKILRRVNTPYGASAFSADQSSEATQAGARFEVKYNGFSEDAQLAFQKAIDIWSELITSDVVIRVNATWQELDEGVLGSAIWNTAYRNFEGAKEVDVWYPVALAEKMAGRDLNSTNDPDIVANFNKEAPWYLGTDGATGAGEFDLITVVLHELGHGLGFIDSYSVDDSGNGSLAFDIPFVFDLGVQNAAGEDLVQKTSTPTLLGTALTSNAVYFNSPSEVAITGSRPRLYAPTEYDGGSSIAHLNESTYPSGNENSLMTPQVAPSEVIHDPGPATLNMFGDMGWEFTYVVHTNRANTENIQADSYTVTTSIKSDIGYKAETVKLHYSTDGFQSNDNELIMTATGNANEFTAEIPSTKTEGQAYNYYFEVQDIKDRVFKFPSLPQAGRYFTFSTDNDNSAPIITHSPPNFIRTTDQSISLVANISDFLPVNAEVEYFFNSGTPQTAQFQLTEHSTSTYTATIDISNLTLAEGDVLSYKISATDIAGNPNSSVSPVTGYTQVNVVATADPVAFYFNDFNDLTTAASDFLNSNNFSIKEETGFDDGAIHSDHPYADGSGSNNESNYIYELKVPIIVNSGEAIMSFDEVVLVEPGEANVDFGDNGFYDYVIVEASVDGGSNWLPLIDGYDARAQPIWQTTYEGSISGSNSTAVGNESMYRSREINLLDNESISGGDEILIRFRLFADEAAHGWGWAIDNLNIQLDNEAPEVVHNHLNYVTSLDQITISANVTDNFDVDSVGVHLMVNDVDQGRISMTQATGNTFQALIDISGLSIGDVVKYKIGAFDTKQPEANSTHLPSADAFFEVPIIQFGTAQETYSNDFNNASNDFVGNFFSVQTASGFNDGAIQSSHPYPLAFGTNGISSFTYTLKQPITVSSTKPYITYNEVLLIESGSDYAALEGSKDNGTTWFEIETYRTTDESTWSSTFQSGGNGSSSLFKTRIIKLTDSPNLSAGDQVILRFKINRRSAASGWGWAIDDLEVQTAVVQGMEDEDEIRFASVYPNPIRNGQLSIQVNNPAIRAVDYSIVSLNGQSRMAGQKLELDNDQKATIDVSMLPSGLFVLKIIQGETAKVYKVLKLD